MNKHNRAEKVPAFGNSIVPVTVKELGAPPVKRRAIIVTQALLQRCHPLNRSAL